MTIDKRTMGATDGLVAALERIEQAAQAVRWRVANTPQDMSALGEEIGALASDSARVSTLFGVYSGLVTPESAGENLRCSGCRTGLVHHCDECSGVFCPDCVQERAGRPLCADCYYRMEDGCEFQTA